MMSSVLTLLLQPVPVIPLLGASPPAQGGDRTREA